MTVGANGVQSGQSGYGLGTEYEVYYNRYSQINAFYSNLCSSYAPDSSFSFESALTSMGTDADVILQTVENKIEGDSNVGNGVTGDLLDWNDKLTSTDDKNNLLFKSENGKLFTNVDFTNNYYEVMDEDAFASKLGFEDYDVMQFENNAIKFYEFDFSGLGDGKQLNEVYDFTDENKTKWGSSMTLTSREVNTDYWSTTASNDPDAATTQEAKLSLDSLQVMINAMPSWVTDDIKNQLSAYTEDTAAFNAEFFKIAIKLFDQTGKYTGKYQ